MSRDYAKVSPRFWTGHTGRQIRESGAEVQVVAAYLLSSPQANMIGLYYQPIPTLCHETGIPFEGASKALRRLSEVGFAHYDEAEEVVWVPEMARHQVADRLKPKDKQVPAVEKEAEKYRKSRYYAAFVERYAKAFSLNLPEPLRSPSGGPSKALRSQEQEQEQKQEQDQEQEQRAPRAPAGSPESKETQSPSDPLGPFRRALADELAVLGSNPLRVAKPERAPAFRLHIDRLGLEAAVELCAEHARACGTVPKTLDWFLDFLAEQPDPDRAPGENPKPGDPDFNDPAAWRDPEDFRLRTDGRTWEQVTGKPRPVYKPPLTPEEEAELRAKGGTP